MATYTDPTQDEALASPEYTSQAGLLDEQAGLNEQTYARTRQDTIRSYQDTLDELSFGLKQAGLQARSQYAGRNLYNASGSLSGTGELVGTELTAPITRRITSAQAGHASDLARLAQNEAQGRFDVKAKKAELLSGVLSNLRSRAQATYKDQIDAENAQIEAGNEQLVAKAKTRADNAKLYNGMIEKGRTPLTLKEANRRRAAGLPVYSYRDSNGNLHNFGETPKAAKASGGGTRSTSGGGSTSSSGYKVSRNYDRTTGTYTGLTFKSSNGQPVSAFEYSQETGQPLDKVLAGSGDQGDQALVQLIRQARAAGDSEETILQDIQSSGRFNHLF